ncbi:hypothetical protein PLEOSDRAFT_155315 [Pleurotus ostreatus PC15]|uniref:Maintenance of mitochondrial morphology protein 1 n=2 Tax=Pleurotus TaxID=5320 RepID=A0A067NRE1_PLEO1|nr:hypothetical protein CCMSSC00406_0000354 [Pleurotus cornucopiae]KDQ30638.1 hypothetical protein PLEOSDRAFT_155315 [Pleurotus ostreatus PC15]
MAGNYVFSLQPTFTQGLILGQLSILVLLILILKYLFLDSTEYRLETSIYHPGVDASNNISLRKSQTKAHPSEGEVPESSPESAEWLNMLLQQIADVYRSKLRDDLPGPEGDEIARRRVEEYANKIRPAGFLDHIRVHSVDLGVSAPRITGSAIKRQKSLDPLSETEFDVTYCDTASVSLSTSYLFNYPMPSFARLPVTLTISLSLFKSSIVISPPPPSSTTPVLTLSVSPDFTLDLTTTSLMGSRAKLANVPKLHELIQHQVRRVLASKATWKVVLPGLSTVAGVRREIKKEQTEDDAW